MKTGNLKLNRRTFFLFVVFIVLFLSYTVNLWKISPPEYFTGFERAPEGLVVGRLIKAEKDGIFSEGGLTGIAYDYDKEEFATETGAIDRYRILQHTIYLNNDSAPQEFWAYRSQTGGHAILYSLIQKVSPLKHSQNLQLFRIINSALTAFLFVLFIGWCYRNFGFKSSLVVFLLLLFSPWVNIFSHNLWWSFWSFYLPFVTMLLLLEKRHNNPHSVSDKKILGLLFIAVFVKCVFSGFEFITSILLAIICPVVYYYLLEKRTFKQFFIFSVKAGICSVGAIIAEMFILVLQLKELTGSFAEGIEHIILSYTKRTTKDITAGDIPSFSYGEVLREYFGGNAFRLGYFSDVQINFHFGFIVLIIFLAGFIYYFLNRKMKMLNSDRSLLVTTLFSLLCPLSWFIIFKQHATEHPHLDYIVWYMPFLLFGFLLIGRVFTSGFGKKQTELS